MTNKIFIIAGNHDQFRRFSVYLGKLMLEEGIEFSKQDFVHVDMSHILGYDGIWGYRIGTWYERPDIDELKLVLLSMRSTIENFLEVDF